MEWAESDLRRQLLLRLGPGNRVSPSSVIGSTFRRASSKRSLLPRRFREACNWIFSIAGRVVSEKNRNARAWKRKPRGAAVLQIGDHGGLLVDPSSPGQRQQLEDALAVLPPDYAALLRAVYFHGLSLREFARREGLDPREASRPPPAAIVPTEACSLPQARPAPRIPLPLRGSEAVRPPPS